MKCKRYVSILAIILPYFLFPADSGWYLDSSAAGGVNPLSARVSSSLYYHYNFPLGESLLLKDTGADAGMKLSLTPADYNVSLFTVLAPLAILDCRVSGVYQRYYPQAGYGFKQVSSPNAEYSSSALSHTDGESKSGYKIIAEPRIKTRFYNFIATDTLTYTHIRMKTDASYYYDPYSDTIHERTDSDWENSANALYQFSRYLIAGCNYDYQYVNSTAYHSHRISFIVIGSPFVSSEHSLRIITLLGSYAENRYYNGKIYYALYVGDEFKLF